MTDPQLPKFPQVHALVAADDSDIVATELFGLGATGVEERDESTFSKGPGGGLVLVVASFETEAEAREAMTELASAHDGIDVKYEELVGDAWRDEWKRYYEPFALTKGVTLCPPWSKVDAKDGEKVLVLEPGRAFGTGLHSTTSLVAELLQDAEAELAGKTILDAGCGSGILSFLAILIGAERAVMFDIDPDVVPTVRENAELNAMEDRVKVFAGTIDDVDETYPWLVANIETRILIPMADALAKRVAPEGHLLLSGILLAEEAEIETKFTSLGRKLRVVDKRTRETGGERAYDRDGWVAIHLVAED